MTFFARRDEKNRQVCLINFVADVAQLVERRVVVPNVAGSSPVVRPKLRRSGTAWPF